MGNVGFSELLLLALITLLVAGPQKLPEVARTVGRWSRQARHTWASLKSEFESEMDRDHNRRILEAEKRGELDDADRQDTDEQPGTED